MRTNGYKLNPWTSALMAAGVVGASSALQAEEAVNPVMTALSATTISGYVDTSAIWGFGPHGRYNSPSMIPGRSYDNVDKHNGFNLNVAKLTIEKPIDASSWGAGYNVGLLFGPDANALGSNSVFENTSDFAIKNAYVALRAPIGNGLDLKIGVWDTLVGYEVFEAGNNPNYSRSYGFFLEPRIHTGILASYEVNEILSLSAGIANDGIWSNSINSRATSNGQFAYLGGLTVTAPESAGFLEGAQLTGAVVYTPGSDGNQDMYNFYAGGAVPLPITGLSAGVAYDHLMGEDTFSGKAVGGYLVYQATEKLKLAGRVEWARGNDGTFGVFTGRKDEYLGVTGTIDYSLWTNAITRLEVRWDHDLASGSRAFYAGSGHESRDAVSLALNVIYKF